MTDSKDRAAGAIVGALIGDALGLGCHWYYDFDEMRRDCGPWVSDYIDVSPDRTDRFRYISKMRHEIGLRGGDVSQTGEVAILLLESVVDRGGYNESDFSKRLDGLLETLDGSPLSGRFTDWAMRDVANQRRSGIEWSVAGSRADTAEAAIRSVVLSALMSGDLERLAREAYSNILLTHREPYVAGQSVAFSLTVGILVAGTSVSEIGTAISDLSGNEFVRSLVPSHDTLGQARNGARAAAQAPNLQPSEVCALNGMNCTLGFMLPSAYYFLHRYPDNFEMAVLSAINGGGNTIARAALTGALSGAAVGLSGIPKRFTNGLAGHRRLLDLARSVSSISEPA